MPGTVPGGIYGGGPRRTGGSGPYRPPGGSGPYQPPVNNNYPIPPPPPPVSVDLNTAPDPRLSGLTDYATGQMDQSDPLLLEAIQNFRDRMSSDTTQRAIGRAGGAADSSLASAMQRAREEASISGTSSGSQVARAAGMTDANERLKAGQAADITLGRERDLDRLAGGFAGVAGAPGQRQLNWFGAAAGAAGASASNQMQGQANQLSAAQLAQQQAAAQQAAMLAQYNLAYA